MLKRTALFSEHQRLQARLVDFAGWEMPVQYQSALEEHRAVRSTAGMFDVSHMVAVDLSGASATAFLRHALANDVARLVDGKALYTCMLNPSGGVIDDLIVYRLHPDRYRIVLNAGPAESDLAWLRGLNGAAAVECVARRDLGILAVQGPQARAALAALLAPALAEAVLALPAFHAHTEGDCLIARTGYTGEDGFEAIAPHAQLVEWWRGLEKAGVRPAGLGARDSLRLEAGMNLYGQDMDATVSPLESGLGWTVAWSPDERDFIGRAALAAQRSAPARKQQGLVLEGRGVMRAHQQVRCADGQLGELTSGGFAPTLNRSVALARLPSTAGAPVEVEIRGQWHPVRAVRPPFVRHGKILV
jgi:aminomethyltransferase